MTQAGGSRAARYAEEFEAAQDQFIDFVDSLTDEQWSMVGKNFPDRIEEDEHRQVGVIAHHVADTQQFIVDRVFVMLEDKPLKRMDFRVINADHEAAHANVTRAEVVSLLRSNRRRLADRIRSIPDHALDVPHETPVGPATIAQRLSGVLVGHMKMHQGSIEAAIS